MATELNKQQKTTRGALRLVPSQKEQIDLAAQLTGRSFNQFVADAAVDAAKQAIDQHLRMELSLKDAEAFAQNILNPREPNDALMKAAKLYRSRTKK
jgi:uncharacterized protein (DUF1778 family)